MLALTIMMFSQCCYYEKPTTRNWEYTQKMPTYAGGGQIVNLYVDRHGTTNEPGKTGWQLHGSAPYLIVGMFVVFGMVLNLGAWWQRWGYWLAVLGLLLCMKPFHLQAAPGWGLLFGCVAVALGISAAGLRGQAGPVGKEE